MSVEIFVDLGDLRWLGGIIVCLGDLHECGDLHGLGRSSMAGDIFTGWGR